ncbi:hypothetical protein J2S00_001460 [Caldalkalibacillus uzonensis]|uniref:Metal-independent alpha-mannosidase n=1 Tax=Caldalkalibacillus uzonensis TaxID=353224 RepID=A0ABU0CS38_9BACI|nr:glycoside hydrolase family 125 protein [Caldalkalibacillus uzonensis]MDQ0338674.1 hypothetical protein [Caldalkalibacillus uzonensis]
MRECDQNKEKSAPELIPVLNVPNKKPLDIGNGRITVSIGMNGRISSINAPHKKHGFITLTPLAQFPDDKWYDSVFVRQYRRTLVDLAEKHGADGGFGVEVGDPNVFKQIYIVDGEQVLISYRSGHLHYCSYFSVVEIAQQPSIVHTLKVYNKGAEKVVLPFTVGGKLSLNRCSYGQLTEGGPIPIPPVENIWTAAGGQLQLFNPNLQARAYIWAYLNQCPLTLKTGKGESGQPVEYTSFHELVLQPEEEAVIQVLYTLMDTSDSDNITTVSGAEWEARRVACLTEELDRLNTLINNYAEKILAEGRDQPSSGSQKPSLPAHVTDLIIKRNLAYILGCCKVPVSAEHHCIMTDHQLLPLSWNRDAYYMLSFLLAADRQIEKLYPGAKSTILRDHIRDTIKGHLLWMFEMAERPQGYWGRAYLTNGYCKDHVFQLDQQCYPLLELCDFYFTYGDRNVVERVGPKIKAVLQMLLECKASEQWLFKTGETPADDKVDYPYHFSSQVLLWYTFEQLARLNHEFKFCEWNLAEWAERVWKDCWHSFKTQHGDKTLFAYLTDLNGRYQFYHDANDLPTVLAPMWGFCTADDRTWLNTMNFAFSKDNHGGYYTGQYAGLGSVHTPHPWPLGDAQELLFARLIKNKEREEKVLKKLCTIVQWDGMFSEAVDEHEGHVTSRHWFSWPGAFIGYVLLS